MKDVNYVVGRLQGLNELVKILKDLVNKKGTPNTDVLAIVTNHVSEQLDSILAELDTIEVEHPEHKEILKQIKEKHTEPSEEPIEEIPDEPEEKEDSDDSGDSEDTDNSEDTDDSDDSADKLSKHEKTVDSLLKDLENMKG